MYFIYLHRLVCILGLFEFGRWWDMLFGIGRQASLQF